MPVVYGSGTTPDCSDFETESDADATCCLLPLMWLVWFTLGCCWFHFGSSRDVQHFPRGKALLSRGLAIARDLIDVDSCKQEFSCRTANTTYPGTNLFTAVSAAPAFSASIYLVSITGHRRCAVERGDRGSESWV